MFRGQRDITDLSEIGFSPSAALRSLMDRFASLTSKLVTFRLIDENTQTFQGGIREYADRFVIWFDPATPRRDYTLAHEYGHGIAMNDPTFTYLDPRRTAQHQAQGREIAGLAASIIEHGQVHDTLRELGFDTAPEALMRTESVLRELTPDLANQVNSAMTSGDRRARAFALHNVDVLTTHRSPMTPEFDKKIRGLFRPEFVALVDASVDVVNRRAASEIDAVAGAVELLRIIGWPELGSYYVSLEVFRANLQAWVP